MIVDASAILAILRDEPDAAFFASALADRAVARRMSAANYLEAAIVIDSAKEPVASRRFDDLVAMAKIAVEAMTADHAAIAAAPIATTARAADIPPSSISAIASLTRWRGRRASRCCAKATTSFTPTSSSAGRSRDRNLTLGSRADGAELTQSHLSASRTRSTEAGRERNGGFGRTKCRADICCCIASWQLSTRCGP